MSPQDSPDTAAYTEAQALHAELTDAVSRTRIRAEYIALSAAAARAQRLVGYLTPSMPAPPIPLPEQSEQ